MEYIQGSLRSAIKVYKEGGQVTMVNRDQIYRMHYDNRRVIEEPKGLEG